MEERNRESLNEAFRQAWSIENREAHGSAGETEYIGTEKYKNRLYDIYRDQDGQYFYSVRIITPEGVKTEYEAIFGRREPARRHHTRERKKMDYEYKKNA